MSFFPASRLFCISGAYEYACVFSRAELFLWAKEDEENRFPNNRESSKGGPLYKFIKIVINSGAAVFNKLIKNNRYVQDYLEDFQRENSKFPKGKIPQDLKMKFAAPLCNVSGRTY